VSFELRHGESLRKGIRRIARKQLDIALEQMTGEHKRVRDEAVHKARKCFKKLPSEAEMLLALIDRRRAELEEESMLLGRRFFQDSPKEFTRRLKGYWKTWRSQAARAA
jgi:hypothetical protein